MRSGDLGPRAASGPPRRRARRRRRAASSAAPRAGSADGSSRASAKSGAQSGAGGTGAAGSRRGCSSWGGTDVERQQPAPEVVARAGHVRDPRSAGRSRPRARSGADGASGRGLCRYQNGTSGGSPVASESQRVARAVALLGPAQVVARRSAKPTSRQSTGFARAEPRQRARGPGPRAPPGSSRPAPREQLARPWSAGSSEHAQHDDGEARPGRPRAQPLGLAGRRDELGRRRLARRDRRLERVAARRASRRRRGPRAAGASRLLLEAGEDRALDRRVEVGHERRGLDRPLVAVLARELGEALALEGAPAGDELVDQRGRARRCRCGR